MHRDACKDCVLPIQRQALMYMEDLKLYASCAQEPDTDEMYGCTYAQALMYMKLKLYVFCGQGPESDEMYADALQMHAWIIHILFEIATGNNGSIFGHNSGLTLL